MISLFWQGIWGTGFIGFALVILAAAAVFWEKCGLLARIGLSLCALFGLVFLIGGLWLMYQIWAADPSTYGFWNSMAYLISLSFGIGIAILVASLVPHHTPIWNAGKF